MLSSLAWFALGIFWRYSKGGRLCSGVLNDPLKLEMHQTGYQIKSGRFIEIYLWVQFAVYLNVILFAILFNFCCFATGNNEKGINRM